MRLTPRWARLIEDYTRLRLTNPADRLKAISGIAQWIQQNFAVDKLTTGGTIFEAEEETLYASGLWLHGLPSSLLWQCISPKNATSSGCEVPSWSWASRCEPIVWPKEAMNGSADCEIFDPAPSRNEAQSFEWSSPLSSFSRQLSKNRLYGAYRVEAELDS